MKENSVTRKFIRILEVLIFVLCAIILVYTSKVFGENKMLKKSNQSLVGENRELKKEINSLKKVYGVTIAEDREQLRNLANSIASTGYTLTDYVYGLQDQITELTIVCEDNAKDNKKMAKRLKSLSKKCKKYKKELEKIHPKKYSLKDNNLSAIKQKRADEIAYITAKNYDKYGILPSVAVGQACEETQLGTDNTSATPYYGWWGVTSKIPNKTYATYGSLEEGCLAYLDTLNNGLYKGAVFNKNYQSATRAIQDGGYCEPRKGYSDRVNDSIEDHNFTEYDKYYLGL